MRHLLLLTTGLTLVFAACDSEGAGVVDSEDVVTGALSDASNPYLPDIRERDALSADGEDTVEPIYPGHPCNRDDECSTGLCYGKSTTQGFFEESLCQLRCLGLEDFTKYCDSNEDCCSGICCTGCGWREGLCVTE